jgi:hypothetical protein
MKMSLAGHGKRTEAQRGREVAEWQSLALTAPTTAAAPFKDYDGWGFMVGFLSPGGW